jgi:hypothetical protein
MPKAFPAFASKPYPPFHYLHNNNHRIIVGIMEVGRRISNKEWWRGGYRNV